MSGVWTHSEGLGALRPCVRMSCPRLPVIADANVVRVRNAENGVNSAGVEVGFAFSTYQALMCILRDIVNLYPF